MQFEVTMRDGTSRYVEAAYLEVVEGPMSTSYTMLGPVPGYPTAIVAAFPAELVQAIKPVTPKPYAQRRPAAGRVEFRHQPRNRCRRSRRAPTRWNRSRWPRTTSTEQPRSASASLDPTRVSGAYCAGWR